MPKYRYVSLKKNRRRHYFSFQIRKNMQIWFKMDVTQSHLRTFFQFFSIVFPCLLIELRHRVSLTLYIIAKHILTKSIQIQASAPKT
jgi:hypothetical protein